MELPNVHAAVVLNKFSGREVKAVFVQLRNTASKEVTARLYLNNSEEMAVNKLLVEKHSANEAAAVLYLNISSGMPTRA